MKARLFAVAAAVSAVLARARGGRHRWAKRAPRATDDRADRLGRHPGHDHRLEDPAVADERRARRRRPLHHPEHRRPDARLHLRRSLEPRRPRHERAAQAERQEDTARLPRLPGTFPYQSTVKADANRAGMKGKLDDLLRRGKLGARRAVSLGRLRPRGVRGSGSGRGDWPLPQRDLAGTRAAEGSRARRRQRRNAEPSLALPLHGAAELRRPLRLDADRPGRDGLRPGSPEQRLRARSRDRRRPLEAPVPGAEQRAERHRLRLRADLRLHRLGRVRARRGEREASSGAAT